MVENIVCSFKSDQGKAVWSAIDVWEADGVERPDDVEDGRTRREWASVFADKTGRGQMPGHLQVTRSTRNVRSICVPLPAARILIEFLEAVADREPQRAAAAVAATQTISRELEVAASCVECGCGCECCGCAGQCCDCVCRCEDDCVANCDCCADCQCDACRCRCDCEEGGEIEIEPDPDCGCTCILCREGLCWMCTKCDDDGQACWCGCDCDKCEG